MLLHGNSLELRVPLPSGENQRHHLPHQKHVCNFIHPKQLSPFRERLELPFPDEEILSGYEEDGSFIRDGFTTCVKADFNIILERHAVDVRKALAEFRGASVRRHDTSAQEYHFDSNVGGCAVLFNKDTFLPDGRRFRLGFTGRAITCLFFVDNSQRPKTFTVMSLHISNIYAKKRGIGKKLILTIRAVMLGEQVDLVAGDFNGAAWRCDNRNNISTIEEAFADCALPMPPCPTPLW